MNPHLVCCQAALGGDPTRLGEVKAFLRVRERDATLDFDAPSGGAVVDTSWQRVFLCLRSGYHQEAVKVCCRLKKAGLPKHAQAQPSEMQLRYVGHALSSQVNGNAFRICNEALLKH